MSPDEIRIRTQKVWDDYYKLSAIWQRADCVKALKSRLAFVLISKLYRQMYANTGIATDSARRSDANRWVRRIAPFCRRLFQAKRCRICRSGRAAEAEPAPDYLTFSKSPGFHRPSKAAGSGP